MISEIKNLRFSQPHWYTCPSLTATCHPDVCVVTETVRNKQKLFPEPSRCRLASGSRNPPVCWRLCLVRACLVPPAKPHMSHRYVFSPGGERRAKFEGSSSREGAGALLHSKCKMQPSDTCAEQHQISCIITMLLNIYKPRVS